MLRSLKIGSVLIACTAALGLGIAAPASADSVGTQAVIGASFVDALFTVPNDALQNGQNCVPITITVQQQTVNSLAQSATLSDTTKTVMSYGATNTGCTGTPVATLNSGNTSASGFLALRYTSN